MYVGETTNIKKRFEDEIRAARHCFHNMTKKKNGTKQNFTYAEKTLARVGWSAFILLPIFNLGTLRPDKGKNIRLTYEKTLIKKLQPSMNTKANKNKTQSTRHNKRKRPLLRFRRISKAPVPLNITSYEITDLKTKDKEITTTLHLSLISLRENRYYRIARKTKGEHLTDWSEVRKNFGNIELFKEHTTLKGAIPSIRSHEKHSFIINYTKQNYAHNNFENLVKSLARHKYANQNLLKKASPDYLLGYGQESFNYQKEKKGHLLSNTSGNT